MKVANREKYLKKLEQKITDSKERLVSLEVARNSAPSAMESRHDTQRETLEMEVAAQKETIKSLELFKDFLKNSSEKSKVEEGAELTVELLEDNELMENVIFAPFTVGLEGLQIITPKSPIGQALLNKMEGEKFSYQIGNTKILGIIKDVS